MVASHPTDDASGFVDRLHLVAVYLLRLVRGQDDAAGVSTARLSALKVVAEHGPLSVRELAARERVRSPTMVQVVNELERRKFVTKEDDPSDKRVTLVRVTDAGLHELAEDRDRMRRAITGALSGLGKGEETSLSRCVDTLYGALKPPEI